MWPDQVPRDFDSGSEIAFISVVQNPEGSDPYGLPHLKEHTIVWPEDKIGMEPELTPAFEIFSPTVEPVGY